MLKPTLPFDVRQRGVVLPITLIVLVVMTLAGVAVVRTVDTSNLIASNLAFRKSAIYSGETGLETAIEWLEANNGSTLFSDSAANGYAAVRQDPSNNQSWDSFWINVLLAGGRVRTLSTDGAGNTVSYAIQRLCSALGEPGVGNACATPPASGTSGSSKSTSFIALQSTGQVYYRITCRVVGPHNTVSYLQVIVVV